MSKLNWLLAAGLIFGTSCLTSCSDDEQNVLGTVPIIAKTTAATTTTVIWTTVPTQGGYQLDLYRGTRENTGALVETQVIDYAKCSTFTFGTTNTINDVKYTSAPLDRNSNYTVCIKGIPADGSGYTGAEEWWDEFTTATEAIGAPVVKAESDSTDYMTITFSWKAVANAGSYNWTLNATTPDLRVTKLSGTTTGTSVTFTTADGLVDQSELAFTCMAVASDAAKANGFVNGTKAGAAAGYFGEPVLVEYKGVMTFDKEIADADSVVAVTYTYSKVKDLYTINGAFGVKKLTIQVKGTEPVSVWDEDTSAFVNDDWAGVMFNSTLDDFQYWIWGPYNSNVTKGTDYNSFSLYVENMDTPGEYAEWYFYFLDNKDFTGVAKK